MIFSKGCPVIVVVAVITITNITVYHTTVFPRSPNSIAYGI